MILLNSLRQSKKTALESNQSLEIRTSSYISKVSNNARNQIAIYQSSNLQPSHFLIVTNVLPDHIHSIYLQKVQHKESYMTGTTSFISGYIWTTQVNLRRVISFKLRTNQSFLRPSTILLTGTTKHLHPNILRLLIGPPKPQLQLKEKCDQKNKNKEQ